MAYNPDNYIKGVDQRTVAQQRKDEKEQAMKRASKLKEGMRKRILNVKTQSPSATDVQSGKVSGAVKSNKSKTTVKEKAMPNMKKPVPASALKKATEKMKSKPKVKITGTASSKPQVSGSMGKSQPKTTAKSKPLTGPAAVKALQDRVSPAGVKKAEMDAKKAIAKKYPGLTKKSK